MGGANNRSLISAHFCISAYFLTAETYKRMRLTTRVYGTDLHTCQPVKKKNVEQNLLKEEGDSEKVAKMMHNF